MPYQTEFDKMNENYKNRTGSFKDRPSAPPSALDMKIAAAAAKALEKMQSMTNPVNNVREIDRRSGQAAAQDRSLMGSRPDFSPTPGAVPEKGTFAPSFAGEIKQGLKMVGQGFSAAGRKAVEPLRALDARLGQAGAATENAVQGFGAEMRQGAKTVGKGFADAARGIGRNIGPALEKVNRGPQGETWMTFGDPNKPAGPAASPTARPTPEASMRTGPNQRPGTDPTTLMRTSPPTDRPPAAAATGDDPGKGQPRPGTASPAAQTNARSSYVDMINAGPEDQAKYIKDANLVHMIRGTDQTWGNPKIQGDLGVKEFKSALEAAAGVDRAEALAKHAIDTKSKTEIAKERIKSESDRYLVQKAVTAESGGAEEIRVFDTKTRSWVEDGSEGEMMGVIQSAMDGSMSEEDQKAYLDGLSKARAKRFRKLLADMQK